MKLNELLISIAGLGIFAACKPVPPTSSKLGEIVDTIQVVRDLCKAPGLTATSTLVVGQMMLIDFQNQPCGQKSGFGLVETSPSRRVIHLNFGGTAPIDQGPAFADPQEFDKLKEVPGIQLHQFRGNQQNMIENVKNLKIQKGENVTFVVSGHGEIKDGRHVMTTTNQGSFDPGVQFKTHTPTADALNDVMKAAGISPDQKADVVISACQAGQALQDCQKNDYIKNSTNSVLASSRAHQSSYVTTQGSEVFLSSYIKGISNPASVPDYNKNGVRDTDDLINQSTIRANLGYDRFVQSNSLMTQYVRNPQELSEDQRGILRQAPQSLTGPVPLPTTLNTNVEPIEKDSSIEN